MRKTGLMIKQHPQPGVASSLARDKRGVVAMWVAVTTPVIAMGLGMGVDVTEWVIANQQLQRAADAGSTAGALKYGTLQNAQIAAGIAADVAEANGAAGSATRTWTAATKTLVANNITVVVANAINNGNNASIAVSVQRSVPATFSKVFSAAAKVVKASATADSTGTITTFQQPCLLTLGKLSATTPDIVLNGSGVLQLPGCSIVSNEQITLSGSSYVNVGTAYAKSSIVVGASSTLVGTKVPNTSLNLADPYAGSTALATDFGLLTNGTTIVNGTTLVNRGSVSISGSGTNTLSPGIYTSLSITSSPVVTFQAGLYVVKGTMSINGSPSITGSNLTFINGSTLTIGGSPTISFSAPGTSATGGTIPGILFASNVNANAANYLQLTGSSSMTLTGVIYFPGTNVNITGSPASNGSGGCFEIIANIISISGSPTMANAGCPGMGVLPVTNSTASTVGAKLLL